MLKEQAEKGNFNFTASFLRVLTTSISMEDNVEHKDQTPNNI